jgi:hypothetical protein
VGASRGEDPVSVGGVSSDGGYDIYPMFALTLEFPVEAPAGRPSAPRELRAVFPDALMWALVARDDEVVVGDGWTARLRRQQLLISYGGRTGWHVVIGLDLPGAMATVRTFKANRRVSAPKL